MPPTKCLVDTESIATAGDKDVATQLAVFLVCEINIRWARGWQLPLSAVAVANQILQPARGCAETAAQAWHGLTVNQIQPEELQIKAGTIPGGKMSIYIITRTRSLNVLDERRGLSSEGYDEATPTREPLSRSDARPAERQPDRLAR
ncbi:hypothetical protein B0H11DRAFT_1905044 [Mycena galericulata]|nr:hypothetical protein B0H11DRAFT_1905044 [Mycena galericulata]